MANKTSFFGCEHLPVYSGSASVFLSQDAFQHIYLLTEDKLLYPVDSGLMEVYTTSEGYVDITIPSHTDLLDSAHKAYVHPKCTIPRNMVSLKYKKCLHPWDADIIVLPSTSLFTSVKEYAVFGTSERILSFYFSPYDTDLRRKTLAEKFSKAPLGTKFVDLAACPCTYDLERYKDAALLYYGGIVELKERYFLDYVMGVIPKEKTVSEEDLLKHLGNKDNAPTLESLMSVYEMLNSRSADMVAAAMKALASLDYANYPISIKTVLREAGPHTYHNNPATWSSSVKYMLKYLGIWRSRCINFGERNISEEDYALTKELIMKLNGFTSQRFVDYAYNLPFVYVDNDRNVIPRLL